MGIYVIYAGIVALGVGVILWRLRLWHILRSLRLPSTPDYHATRGSIIWLSLMVGALAIEQITRSSWFGTISAICIVAYIYHTLCWSRLALPAFADDIDALIAQQEASTYPPSSTYRPKPHWRPQRPILFWSAVSVVIVRGLLLLCARGDGLQYWVGDPHEAAQNSFVILCVFPPLIFCLLSTLLFLIETIRVLQRYRHGLRTWLYYRCWTYSVMTVWGIVLWLAFLVGAIAIVCGFGENVAVTAWQVRDGSGVLVFSFFLLYACFDPMFATFYEQKQQHKRFALANQLRPLYDQIKVIALANYQFDAYSTAVRQANARWILRQAVFTVDAALTLLYQTALYEKLVPPHLVRSYTTDQWLLSVYMVDFSEEIFGRILEAQESCEMAVPAPHQSFNRRAKDYARLADGVATWPLPKPVASAHHPVLQPSLEYGGSFYG